MATWARMTASSCAPWSTGAGRCTWRSAIPARARGRTRSAAWAGGSSSAWPTAGAATAATAWRACGSSSTRRAGPERTTPPEPRGSGGALGGEVRLADEPALAVADLDVQRRARGDPGAEQVAAVLEAQVARLEVERQDEGQLAAVTRAQAGLDELALAVLEHVDDVDARADDRVSGAVDDPAADDLALAQARGQRALVVRREVHRQLAAGAAAHAVGEEAVAAGAVCRAA